MHLRRRWGTVDEITSAALQRAEPMTRGHDVEVNIEADLPVVRVDERAVSEVVYTLVDNAAKYSPKGTSIRITAQRYDEGMIKMAVEDAGGNSSRFASGFSTNSSAPLVTETSVLTALRDRDGFGDCQGYS